MAHKETNMSFVQSRARGKKVIYTNQHIIYNDTENVSL